MSTSRCAAAAVVSLLCVIFGCPPGPGFDEAAERPLVEAVIKDSIGWAKTKDTRRLYECFAQDDDLFWFNPEKGEFVRGFDTFRETVETVFLDPRFEAVRFEVRDLRLRFARAGNVAWYSCLLDDENLWAGRPASWFDVRWTGVLEKRDGRWVIVQMHFSHGSDPRQAS